MSAFHFDSGKLAFHFDSGKHQGTLREASRTSRDSIGYVLLAPACLTIACLAYSLPYVGCLHVGLSALSAALTTGGLSAVAGALVVPRYVLPWLEGLARSERSSK